MSIENMIRSQPKCCKITDISAKYVNHV